MQVSCKISYSVLVYLERQGVQLDPFFESFETPVEFLKDPSCWLPVEKMEEFLSEMALFLNQENAQILYREIGQNNFELRAWGVLDSVLKMVESPKDIFAQPDRFLSYFLTPPPEFTVSSEIENKLLFSFEEYPTAQFVLFYLIGAVEGLPNYMGRPPAKIEPLAETTFQITWYDDQQSLFDEQEKKRRQFHPEIVHSVMQNLRDHQHALDTDSSMKGPEQIASEAFERMVSLEVEKRMGQWASQQQEIDETFFKIKNDFYKMYDYFTRAQQIITLVSPTARKASVREAMRRVDWEHIQKEFPKMVESACDSILSLKDAFHMSLEAELVAENKDQREPTNLNELIDNVVEKLSIGERSINIDKRLMLDKNVLVEPKSFSQAVAEVLNSSVATSSKGGEMKIVTRPVGSKIQIEITDNSSGFSSEILEHIFDRDQEYNLKSSQEIIEKHHGNISISSRVGEGSTYLIELPI